MKSSKQLPFLHKKRDSEKHITTLLTTGATNIKSKVGDCYWQIVNGGLTVDVIHLIKQISNNGKSIRIHFESTNAIPVFENRFWHN